jgi:hypothetical protein
MLLMLLPLVSSYQVVACFAPATGVIISGGGLLCGAKQQQLAGWLGECTGGGRCTCTTRLDVVLAHQPSDLLCRD